MASREISRHRSSLIWQKILTGGAAAVFFALVNMVILPEAELVVRAEEVSSTDTKCILTYDDEDQNLKGTTVEVIISEVINTDSEYATKQSEAGKVLRMLKNAPEDQFTNLDFPIYDIKILSNGVETEPASEVTVKIELPTSGYSAGDIKVVIHFTDNGIRTIKGEVVEIAGKLYMSFKTKTFSDFMITDIEGADSNIWIVENGDELRRAIEDTTFINGTVVIDAEGDGKEFEITYPNGVGAPQLYKNLKININSHYITVNGTFIDVKSGATLTITDNMATDSSNDVTGEKSTYGNKAIYDPDSKKLTYYITETAADSTGITTETVIEHVVTGCGVITGTKEESAYAVFYVDAATLIIESGMIANSQSCAVNMVGSSTLQLNGGYICGNNVLGGSDGGAIRADGSCTINMSGSVLAGNVAQNGGAIDIKGVNSKLLISGGVISGNQAVVNGGAIVSTGIDKFEITGGYITNNIASIQDNNNENGGGGIVIYGDKKLTLGGGFITGNLAASGGGIYTTNNSGATFEMNGGFITANHTIVGEGGGIRVGGGCMADFNAGYITNNETETSEHWGGGGIFIAETASGFAEKVLVKNNKAGGFGGGVAGCSTGLIYMSATNPDTTGIAIFLNKADGQNLSGGTSAKHDDHSYARRDEAFYTDEKNYQDYFSMLYSHITDTMLGGGYHNWKGSIDGQQIGSEITIAQGGTKTSNSVAGLTSVPSDPNNLTNPYQAAETNAHVYVTGNVSHTHGGGILCNGYMIFGDPPSDITASTRLEVHGSVQYLNWASNPISMTDDQFTFSVAQENSVTSAIMGMNYASGDVRFKRRLTFAADGTYEYIVKQTSPDSIIANGKIDRTEYKVTVITASGTQPVITITSPDGSSIEIWMREIDSINVAKKEEGATEWTPLHADSIKISYKDVQYSHAVAVYLTDGVYSFTNYNLTPPPPTTDDSTGDSQPVAPVEPENQEVITQTAEGELPQTGQNWMSVILLACAGCICLIIGIALKRVEHEWD